MLHRKALPGGEEGLALTRSQRLDAFARLLEGVRPVLPVQPARSAGSPQVSAGKKAQRSAGAGVAQE